MIIGCICFGVLFSEHRWLGIHSQNERNKEIISRVKKESGFIIL